MEFVSGERIEALEGRAQEERDRAAAALVALVLRELFAWGYMQTDPNFANYRWQAETGRLVLLDFGAAREVQADTRRGYHRLLMAALSGSRDQVREAAVAAGFLGAAAAERHRPAVDRMVDVILAELNRPGPFDSGDRSFVAALREEAVAMAQDRSTWHVPPIDTLFVQRKVSGTALLCARLKAQVDIRSRTEAYRDAI
jgi:predicted unusual protein kinase regulating ubiquinone biosynthesis (AarF/ABC1/UbiB family)